MHCTRCNAPLEEGALYCKACGTQHAVLQQRAKVEEIAANIKGLIITKLKSPVFLVTAILFTLMFVGQIASMFTGGIGGFFGGILPFIFMLIATIGLWKGYAAKAAADASAALRKASIYDAYIRVLYTISIVLTGISAFLCIILVAAGGQLVSGLLASSGLVEEGASAPGGIVAIVIVAVIFIIVITVISIFRGVYAKRRAYFLTLAQTVETGSYTAPKAPVVGSYVIGGFSVLGAIPTITFATASQALLSGLIDGMAADLGEIGALLQTALASAMSGLVISSISSLIAGSYMILSAVWMAKVHKAEMANAAAAVAEQARLVEIEDATREAMATEEAKKRADEEARKSEMMQMMQMMMAQNVTTHVAQAAAPAASAAPMAAETEAAPEQEAPAVPTEEV